MSKDSLKLFEDKKIRTHWRNQKQRLLIEGNESVTNCHALKAEPFKMWLTQVGSERMTGDHDE